MSKPSPKKSKAREKSKPSQQIRKETPKLLQKKVQLVEKDVSSAADGLWRKAFYGLLGLAFVVMILLSLKSGMNGDDYFQDAYSEQLLKWYATMGKDTSCFYHPRGPIQYYGGMYEIIAGATNHAVGLTPEDPAYHDVRHIWNAIFGWLAILFAGFFVKEIGGWLAGLLAVGFLFLSPRFLGHSLMNPKDIPFAAGYIMSLFFILRVLKELPKPGWKTLAGLAIAIAIGFGIRAGGLLLVAYLGMFAALEFFGSYGFKAAFSQLKLLVNYKLAVLIPAVSGLIIGLLFWPYALVDPFSHVPEALAELEKYGINIRMLFNGEMIFSDKIPPYYTALWMLVSLPLFSLLGIGLFLAFAKGIFKRYPTLSVFMAIFAFVFPILYVIVKQSPMYDGWRHMIFPYTSAIALIALGWDYVLHKFETKKTVTYVIAGVLALTALEPAWFIVRNSHLPYVYFNPLIGGNKGAFGKFEMDYWGVASQQGVEWLEKQGILKPGMTDTVTIASDFNYPIERYLKKKYGDKVIIQYAKYRQRNDKSWDYALFGTRFIDGEHLLNGTWPTLRTVHSVKVGGVPVLAVMKDTDGFAYRGQQAFRSGSYDEAIKYFKDELMVDSLNELAVTSIANAYFSMGNPGAAKPYIEMHDRIVPNNYITKNLWGSYYLQLNDQDKAVAAFKDAVNLQDDNATGLYYIALIYMNQNKLNDAADYAKKAVEASPSFKAAYELTAQIYEKLGDTRMANAYREAMQKIQ